MAIGVMRALQDMGRTVPGDVSLMGYDGIAMARYCVPRLATICQDTGRMARRGGEMLLHRIYSQRPAAHELVPFQLIRGESVRPVFPDTERLL